MKEMVSICVSLPAVCVSACVSSQLTLSSEIPLPSSPLITSPPQRQFHSTTTLFTVQ